MKKDTEVSPHGLLLDNQTPVLPNTGCLSLSLANATMLKGFHEEHVGMCVNVSSFGIITLSLCNIWKTNDYVMHNLDMTYSFMYLHTLSDLQRTAWGRKHTRDLSKSDISPPACSHLPGGSLVSTPQSIIVFGDTRRPHQNANMTAQLKVHCMPDLSVRAELRLFSFGIAL